MEEKQSARRQAGALSSGSRLLLLALLEVVQI
jgi:hypothetical protein